MMMAMYCDVLCSVGVCAQKIVTGCGDQTRDQRADRDRDARLPKPFRVRSDGRVSNVRVSLAQENCRYRLSVGRLDTGSTCPHSIALAVTSWTQTQLCVSGRTDGQRDRASRRRECTATIRGRA